MTSTDTAGAAGAGPPAIEVRTVTRKLGLAGVIGIIFFSVSGGPYGLEDTLVGGLGAGLLLIIVTPLVWSLPTAFMVAELGTMMPVQGGYYQWVKRSLGGFWGFQEGWWSWVVSWVDLAIYPVLFVDFLSAGFGIDVLDSDGGSVLARWLVCIAVIVPLTLVNMRGSDVVGNSSKIFLVIVLAPFALIVIVGLFKLKYNPFSPMVFEGYNLPRALGDGLFVVMWNYMGWDGLSTVMGEVDQPRRTFPKALAICIPMIALIYLLPTLVSTSVLGNTITWEAGAYTTVAEGVAGPWLGKALTITALVSAIGLFSAWLLSYSRIPFALADDGWLSPRLTRLHPRYGSPVACIIIASAICAVASFGPFTSLVAIDVTVYAAALLLQFAALIRLRISEPDVERPFRVPGGWPGLIVATLLPAGVTAIAIWYQYLDVGLFWAVTLPLLVMGTGPLAWLALRGYRQRQGIDRSVDLATGELVTTRLGDGAPIISMEAGTA